MKKIILSGFILVSAMFAAKAQTNSTNPVEYMVTYDVSKAVYTAWVVPNYETPNSNNQDTEEKVITAQFSIKVPKGFEISKVMDVHGVWEKTPIKLGSQLLSAGIDPDFEYYIIGKSPEETNLGTFKSGEPVAMFNFSSNSNKSTDLKVLEKSDSFVNIAYNNFALNVQPSFYSKSGQKASPTALPLEQFVKGVSLDEVKNSVAAGINDANTFKADPSENNNMSVYPNPVESDLNVKFFSLAKNTPAEITIMDVSGKVLKSELVQASNTGYNTSKVSLGNIQGGTYYIKTKVGDVESTKKIVK